MICYAMEVDDDVKFSCEECPRSFKHLRSLKRHVASLHPNKLDEFSKVKTAEFSCSSCDMVFHKLYLLKNHKAKEHPTTSRVHKCVICSVEYTKKQLLSHLQMEHGISLPVKELQFPNETDFFSWKEDIERNTSSLYIKTLGLKSSRNGTTCYFECHRSGYYEARGNNERQLKIQGSNKINSYCPASIKLVKSSDGICSVSFMSKHVGHRNEISHIFLSSKDKELIAAKMPFDTILDEIRDGVSDSRLERIHLLTKKDLYNIEKMYNLQSSGQRHMLEVLIHGSGRCRIVTRTIVYYIINHRVL
ncbi:hypothetical protein AVEN_227039-1 [Araneus ventricosus]|uniref:C2H2-type domain-containing protein n=1 Tax=Araneus ventricosus TaxID=182803 RepID=A0A4Y2TCN6_ARAVE|nr:hypothetical protein AVEN_227039-1 [Araneus ventricosus]